MSDQLPRNEPFTIEGVFANEEIACLEKYAIIEPVSVKKSNDGACTVTMSRLQVKPARLLYLPAPSQGDDDIDAGEPWKITVPLARESPAVLEFLGFTSSNAKELWSGYMRQKSTTAKPLKLMDYLYEHISLLQTPLFRDMDINKAMMLIGIERDIMRTFFKPPYSGVVKSHSLYNWVKHALKDRYGWMLKLQKELKRRAGWLDEWEECID